MSFIRHLKFYKIDLSNTTQKVNLELLDLSGRVVLTRKIAHQEQIDISFLPQGMYGYRVLAWNGELFGVGKLVKE